MEMYAHIHTESFLELKKYNWIEVVVNVAVMRRYSRRLKPGHLIASQRPEVSSLVVSVDLRINRQEIACARREAQPQKAKCAAGTNEITFWGAA
jgi:hypothetical protein